ncbi:MAG TPA: hypothetical protein VFK41_12005 [Nocardioidaceae bacterium]|nr:hypothetical protein [Nocardioidaceae bacterium]
MSRLARTMLIGIAAAVAVLAFAVGLVYVNIMGGFDDLLNGDAPKETDAEVVAAREPASVALRTSGQSLAKQTELSTGGRLIAAGELHPPCDIGQHNWKIDDPYDLLCDLSRVAVIGSPSVAAFRDQMVVLDATLVADGWEPSSRWGLQRILADYWDERGGFSSSYTVDDLPSASYSRWSGDELRELSVQWATVGSDAGAITYYEDSLSLAWAEGSETTIPAVLSEIPAEGYAVVLSESVTYFEE